MEEVKLIIRVEIIQGRYVLMHVNGQWNLFDIIEYIEADHADD